ncbi:MAG: response regulator [Desulfobulbaceae bacterium]|nr:response regulator [Desulfobulbaceae bacterium]
MGRSGTGLGLTIVWNTLEEHDGSVWVESNNEGTFFQLFFSEAESNQKKTDITVTSAKNIQGNKENILIVDDEPHLRDLAANMLEKLGYRVNSVDSGELALEYIKDKPVDLILLDMLMKPGINGYQTYKEILKLYPDQKAIIASGFSESDDVKAAVQIGVSGYIKKPYLMNQPRSVLRSGTEENKDPIGIRFPVVVHRR